MRETFKASSECRHRSSFISIEDMTIIENLDFNGGVINKC